MDIKPFVKLIESRGLKCEGVLVFRHGKKTAEYRWIPETPRNSFSVSKSFVSVAIGMAVERGKLSLDRQVLDYFPGLVKKPGKRLASLTLEQLLTMTRGHGEFSRPASAAEALGQELNYDPGSRFVYDNGSTFLASAVFTQALGKTVREYLLDALFGPLGIPDPEWAESTDGYTVGATGLMLSTSSLARFGLFLLRKGKWRGKQLVSGAWIDAAGRPQVSTEKVPYPDCNLGYGYFFWPCRHGAFRADGKDGQFVVVLPRQDAVVAINAGEEKPYPILYTVWDEILPRL
jgi:CubicO group peptidase (beta-lactamase class C family)